MLVVNGVGPQRTEVLPRCSTSALPQAELMAQRLSCVAATTSHSVEPSPSTSSQSSPSNSESCLASRVPTTRHPLGFLNGRLFSMDDFDFLEVLGEGFFGTVQKVRRRSDGEVMVMKLCKERGRRDCRRLIAREAAVLERVAHEGVLALRGICLERTRTGWESHLLVDYCDGGSLHSRVLQKHEPLPWEFRVRIAHEIASAMAFVHSRRIIHRDLTSMNVLLRRTNGVERAVIADFGLSCDFPKDGEKLAQVGTTFFMAPECLNEEYYDEKADVFSYGIILCQLIARIEVDPDSGLHRTPSFGLNYVLFTSYCPSDTPLELLQLAFSACLMNPRQRPSFSSLAASLRRLRARPSPHVECRLGRSHSDAALKAQRTPEKRVLVPRQSSSSIRPLREGREEDPTTSAMEALALSAARGDGEDGEVLDDVNPFLDHARYRSQRKILPQRRLSESRQGESRPHELLHFLFPLSPRKRCQSLPSLFESPKSASLPPSASRAASPTSPGRIPIAFRDFDREFVVARKRNTHRRHTVMTGAERGLSLPLSLAHPPALPSPSLNHADVLVDEDLEVVAEQPQSSARLPSSSSWDLIADRSQVPQDSLVSLSPAPSLSCAPCRTRRKEQCVIL